MKKHGSLFLIMMIAGISLIGCDPKHSKLVTGNDLKKNIKSKPEAIEQSSWELVNEKVFKPRCTSCHGAAGGVDLGAYESAKKNLAQIYSSVFEKKSMPKGGALDVAQMEVLLAWVEADAPLTPKKAAPKEPPKEKPLKSKPEDLDRASWQLVSERVFIPRCTSCHGKAGGINLESYESAKKDLTQIYSSVFERKSMPKGRPLEEAQLTLLLAWVEAGGPMSARKPEPPPDKPPEKPPEKPPVKPEPPLEATYKSIGEMIGKRCYDCHYEMGTAFKYPFESYNDLFKSYEVSGVKRTIIIPGNPEESLFVELITPGGPYIMPPKDKGYAPITDAERATIIKWIKEGAKKN